MHYLLIHRGEAWTLWADSAASAETIIGLILLLSPIASRGTISGIDRGCYWKAERTLLDPGEKRRILKSTGQAKIIHIRKTPPTELDAIYLTRSQKER